MDTHSGFVLRGDKAKLNLKAFALNYVSLFMLLFLTVDALYANWTFNPIWDFLYARIQLNLFYNTHAASVLFVCASAYWLITKKDGIPVGVFAAFGIASIHELMLDFVDISVFGISSGISIKYAIYLFGFLGLGFMIIKPYHRRVWAVATGTMFAWFVILTALPHYSTISPACDFCPSQDFYNPIANLEEVASWLVPAMLWFLPRRWFIRQKSQ